MFHEPWVPKLIFVLGISNAVLVTLIFASCRCIPMFSSVGQKLMKFDWYQRFYKVHCFIWPLLWVSVLVHAVFAYKFYGNPFN